MRPLVSYDDIASQAPTQESQSSPHGGSGSPSKKRRRNNRQGQRQGGGGGGPRNQYHNDDYEEEYRDPPKKKPRRDYGLKEESKQLTHEDVWDDSALIRAWDAAVEEYEVLNGPDKKWKAEPINKSALWYNIPPEKDEPSGSGSPGPSFLMPSIPAAFAVQAQAEEEEQEQDPDPSDMENSRPVNFDTFIPHHDPSLSHVNGTEAEIPNGTSGVQRSVVPPAPAGGNVTKEEAFQQAMGAWYWAGYWTGVYHTAGGKGVPPAAQADVEGGNDDGTAVIDMDGVEQDEEGVVDGSTGEEARADDEDLIPT